MAFANNRFVQKSLFPHKMSHLSFQTRERQAFNSWVKKKNLKKSGLRLMAGNFTSSPSRFNFGVASGCPPWLKCNIYVRRREILGFPVLSERLSSRD